MTGSLEQAWEEHDADVTACRLCPRLVTWRESVAKTRRRAYQDQEYWGRPVPGFGDRQAQLMVVGLAPAAHGANRTGRMFTGDSSGDFLIGALYRHGFASQPTSQHNGDGLQLINLYLTAVCRCAPPKNRPSTNEIANCLPYLQREITLLKRLQGVVALGRIAFDGVLRAFQNRGHNLPRLEFKHGIVYELGDGLPWLVASYHPSRQNTQTGRLTAPMFDGVWREAARRLSSGPPASL